MKSYERVYETVNLDAIRHNMEAFRSRVRSDAMLAAVIKTDGYGLGAVPVAQVVEDLVWGYCVATADEALNLRRNGIKKPILILGWVPEERFPDLIQEEIRFCLFDREEAKKLSSIGLALGKKAIAHLKIDTGMGRIGVFPEDILALARFVASLPGIEVEGMFSHIATADCEDRTDAWKQTECFQTAMKELEAAGIHIPLCHIGNSAAAMEMSENVPGRMFRIGISLYGYEPSEIMSREFPLEPSMELKTRVVYVKKVPAGTPIGYGETWRASRDSVIATVTIGYGDGYPRSLSNTGCMLVRGKRAPIVGRVCMDQTMLDVTDIEGVCAGDTVTVVGCDGDASLTLDEVSAVSGRFNYEFICDISKRVPRIYFRNGKECGSKDYFEDDYSVRL